MKNVIIISSLLAVVACKTETPKEVKLENELDSVSYSLGVNIGENINKQFEEYSLDNFVAGMKGVLNNEEEPKIETTKRIENLDTPKIGRNHRDIYSMDIESIIKESFSKIFTRHKFEKINSNIYFYWCCWRFHLIT